MPLADRAIREDGGDDIAWAEARRLYEETDTPATDIATRIGAATTKALYRIASRRGWKRHGWTRAVAPVGKAAGRGERAAGRQAAGRAPGQASGGGRQALVRKLERTVAREIAAIDARLRKYAVDGKRDTQGIDHERHAKALATLARTLRELAAVDRADTLDRRADAATGEDDDDEFPRDADALRDTLARRLEQLSQGGKA